MLITHPIKVPFTSYLRKKYRAVLWWAKTNSNFLIFYKVKITKFYLHIAFSPLFQKWKKPVLLTFFCWLIDLIKIKKYFD